jgi:hypothetical protein
VCSKPSTLNIKSKPGKSGKKRRFKTTLTTQKSSPVITPFQHMSVCRKQSVAQSPLQPMLQQDCTGCVLAVVPQISDVAPFHKYVQIAAFTDLWHAMKMRMALLQLKSATT